MDTNVHSKNLDAKKFEMDLNGSQEQRELITIIKQSAHPAS